MPENNKNILKNTYIPFGLGPRTCIGMNFAMIECIIFLLKFLRTIKFKHIGKHPEPFFRTTLGFKEDLNMILYKIRR